MKRATLDALQILALSLTYVLGQLYIILYPPFGIPYPTYGLDAFLIGVALPLTLSVLLPLVTRRKILLYAFLAYFWALVEDGPVYLDAAYKEYPTLPWPAFARSNPAAAHIFLEVVYHILTATFLFLTVREASKGKTISRGKAVKVSVFTFSAFVLAYAQNVPLNIIQAVVANQWYQLDLVEHILSALVLLIAVREAMN